MGAAIGFALLIPLQTLAGVRLLRAAAAEGHLSEVSGIGGKRRELLLELGIASLDGLAATDPEQLATQLEVHGEQHREMAAQLVAQAQVQAEGRPRRIAAAVGQALPELVHSLDTGVAALAVEAGDWLPGEMAFARMPKQFGYGLRPQAD